MTTRVYERATEIRAHHNFKLADSLHLAAAIEAGCGSFLTNDTRPGHFPDLAVDVLP
jgi:predicted nucleic acid-binding protein